MMREQYTYSAVWLAFGVALLLGGIALKSQPARIASAAVVILTTGKVFLYDLAGVQGVYRAFSFIGLGVVLIGIGLLYQRLLFRPPQAEPVAPAGEAPATKAQKVIARVAPRGMNDFISFTRRRCCSPPPTPSAAVGRPSARPANAD